MISLFRQHPLFGPYLPRRISLCSNQMLFRPPKLQNLEVFCSHFRVRPVLDWNRQVLPSTGFISPGIAIPITVTIKLFQSIIPTVTVRPTAVVSQGAAPVDDLVEVAGTTNGLV